VLNIITITKDDFEGVAHTIRSTEALRTITLVRQIIIDSSVSEVRNAVENFARQHNNVEYVWQPPAGIAPAFNLGLKMAEAEWIWFLNGRDIIHPSLEVDKLLYLLNSSKADAIIFELEFMQSGTRYKHPPMWQLWPPVFNWIPHPATIVRRKMFEQYGQFDERYTIAMDGDIWFRFFSKEVIVDMLSVPIALYDESGVSSVQLKALAGEVSTIIRRNLRMLLNLWLENGKRIIDAVRHFHKLSK
jgi:hypothetical protein